MLFAGYVFVLFYFRLFRRARAAYYRYVPRTVHILYLHVGTCSTRLAAAGRGQLTPNSWNSFEYRSDYRSD